MRVKIEFTVEVDAEAWTATYGVQGAAEIREDVRLYVKGQVDDSAAASECGLVVR